MKTTRIALIYLLSSWACPESTASQVIGAPRRNRNGDDTARTGSRVNRHLNQPGTPARLFHKTKMHLRGAKLLVPALIEEDEAEAEVAAAISMSMSTKMGDFGAALVEPTIAAVEEPETTTVEPTIAAVEEAETTPISTVSEEPDTTTISLSAVGASEPTIPVVELIVVTSSPTSASSSAPSSSPTSAPSPRPTKADKEPVEDIAALVGDVPNIVTHSIVIDEMAGNGGKPLTAARDNEIADTMVTDVPSAKSAKNRRRARIRNM